MTHKMGQQGYQKRTQFIRSFRVMQYDSLYERKPLDRGHNKHACFCSIRTFIQYYSHDID